MQVYIVEEGEYSDKYVVGVFSTKEKANEYVAMRKFTDNYDECYIIREWKVDEVYNNKSVNLILLNNEIYNFDSLSFQIDWLYDMFEYCTDRVIEVTKDYIENYFKEYNSTFNEDVDLMFNDEKINLPIYIVKGVIYNPNKDVMKKVVYDSIIKYKAEKEGL